MHARLRITILVAGVLALAGLVGVLAWAAGRETGEASGFAGAQRPPGIAPTDFDGLADEDGRPVRLADLRGKPVVVTFMYSTCEDTCPLTAQQIRGALDDLGHDVPVVAISVDPPNDTRARAKRFLVAQQVIGRIRFLTGPRAALARQWKAYGIAPQGQDGREHSGHTVLLDGRGVQRVGWPASKLTPEGLVQDLRVLERRAAQAPT